MSGPVGGVVHVCTEEAHAFRCLRFCEACRTLVYPVARETPIQLSAEVGWVLTLR
jgi:hypothetical protein